MRFISDLHIHSRFSRATSKTLGPEELWVWARKKGITVIGTGDFTHPGWLSELKDRLVEDSPGLYRLKPELERELLDRVPAACSGPTRFLLSGEISCIYKKNDRTRKVHHLILMPDIPSVEKFNRRLRRIGNLASDGRPILGLDSRDLLEITLETSDRAFFIPAHIWTPWFSVFGSKSGFDSLEECFEDLTGHIRALETGLSSDPPMNRLFSSLDPYLLVSNSDAHSAAKLGREANRFETELDYDHILQALTDGRGFEGTIEFYPEEGKYHLDGHRKCHCCFHPAETRDHGGICPVCGHPLTVGVLHRIHELADRKSPRLQKDFKSLIPLPEILSELLHCGPATKKVHAAYREILSELGGELPLLLDAPLEEIQEAGGPLLAEAIRRMRRDRVIRKPGYDGDYGTIRLFEDQEIAAARGQMALFGASRRGPGRGVKRNVSSTTFLDKKAGEEPSLKPVPAQADPILDPLNPEQTEAVCRRGGNLLVVAGPGTGKTMTLTHRIAYLLREGLAAPDQVLVLTFTRKAAREVADRIARLLFDEKREEQKSASSDIRVTTFHGFSLEVLRGEAERAPLSGAFSLCSEPDAEALAREAFEEASGARGSASGFLRALAELKSASVLGTRVERRESSYWAAFDCYQRRLRALGMLDLEDLQVEALRLLQEYPEVGERHSRRYPWIFVDEYQDTNPVQAGILKSLVVGSREQTPSIFAIGDPDQAIYGFRGADVGNFHRFPEDFPETEEIVLSRNYRSTRPILEASAALMGMHPLKGRSDDGGRFSLAECKTEAEEAEMVVEQIEVLIGGTSYFSLDSGRVGSREPMHNLGFGDIAVLYRLNAQGAALQEALSRAGIPFALSGEEPLISRYPVSLLWRFFQAVLFPENPYYRAMYDSAAGGAGCLFSDEAFEAGGNLQDLIDRAVAYLGMELPDKPAWEALERIKDLAGPFGSDLRAFLDHLSQDRGVDHTALPGDRVALMSLHAAKGLQWSIVFVVGCEDGLIPFTLYGRDDGEEERRLLYVGITRAEEQVILSRAGRRRLKGRFLQLGPSPFLAAIPGDICRPLERGEWKPRPKKQQQLGLFSA